MPPSAKSADCALMTAARRLQDQVRAGQGLEDLQPELKDRPGDLGELIQTPEGDEPVGEGRQCADVGRRLGWLKDPEAVGEANRLLGVIGVACTRRVEIGVGQAIVHRGEARGGRRSEHGHLDGAGFRAKTSMRLWAVCRVVSTKISIRSARTRSAT